MDLSAWQVLIVWSVAGFFTVALMRGSGTSYRDAIIMLIICGPIVWLTSLAMFGHLMWTKRKERRAMNKRRYRCACGAELTEDQLETKCVFVGSRVEPSEYESTCPDCGAPFDELEEIEENEDESE